MVTDKMLFIPRILFHALVVFNVLEHDLAEAVEICNVCHLRVEQFGHQSAGRTLIMDLDEMSVWRVILFESRMEMTNFFIDTPTPSDSFLAEEHLTCVHLLMPYLTMRSFVKGADTSTICLR